MKQHHLAAMKAQRLDRLHNHLRSLVKIRHDRHDPAPMQKLLKVRHRLRKVSPRPRLRLLQPGHQSIQLTLPRRRPNVLPHLVVKHDQPRRVALIVDRQIEQSRRNVPRVIHLRHRVRAELHRVACIQQQRQLAVRLAAIPLQIRPLRSRKQIPIHVPQIIPRRIRAVLCELLAAAEVRRPLQPRHKPIHDRLRNQVERRDAGQHRGIEKPLQHQLSFGGGICAINRRRISSESIRSDSA